MTDTAHTFRALGAASLALALIALAGCGGSAHRNTSGAEHASAEAGRQANGDALVALRAARAPAAWQAARIPSGAVLFFPPGWRLVHGDRGTVTATTSGAGGRIAGYLNLTPRQSNETLADWAAFRVAHNVTEGEREVRREGRRSNVPFANGIGTCVRDSYLTSTGARYVELACLVRGTSASSVIVGAATRGRWGALAPSLETAISAVRT
jgi:hypothetical protein